MLLLGCEDPLLNGQDARLCVLKFIDPLHLSWPEWKAGGQGTAATVENPVYLTVLLPSG